MARQRKTLPTRGHHEMDDSLLIRSAESIGRVIGSLQRQLDAARRLTLPSTDTVRGNGHVSGRERVEASSKSKAKRSTKTAAVRAKAEHKDAREAKTRMKKTPARRRSATRRRPSKSAT
jgi:hypothetical protein